MNISTYVFGSFRNGYSQFPDDSMSSVFQEMASNAKATTQIIVHRNGTLMYYSYIRKLEEDRYIGLCGVINNLMLADPTSLFKMFENIVSGLVTKGQFIHFDDQADIVTNVGKLYMQRDELDELSAGLSAAFNKHEVVSLPPVSYAVSNNSVKEFSIGDSAEDILEASSKYAYTYIYKSKGYNTHQMSSYKGIINRLSNEKAELQERCDALSAKLSAERIKQRNLKWVAALGVVIIVMGVVLWNKVLFPSEVTRYQTEEFVYYGPLNSSKKPDGVGVAVYPDNDKDGRRFYIGRFVNGNRDDKEAMLLYKNGSFFYGAMSGNQWKEGILYNFSDSIGSCHFKGTFQSNQPYNGIWYDHKKANKVKDGEDK